VQVPFSAVVGCGYGDASSFLHHLEERQVAYVCAVARSFGVGSRTRSPGGRIPRSSSSTETRPTKKPRPAPRRAAEQVIADVPENMANVEWRQEPSEYSRSNCRHPRAWATGSARHSASHGRVETGPEGWLVADGRFREKVATQMVLQFVSADCSLQRLAEVAHLRWRLSNSMKMPRANVAWMNTRAVAGWLHRHLALVMLAYCFLMLQASAPAAAFSPLSASSESAAIHRQILVWLFQDLVHWLIQTNQVQFFRPRRN